MRSGSFAPFGDGGSAVEVDETYIGRDKSIKPDGVKKGRGFHHKNKVLSLIDRASGQARSFVVDDVKASTIAPIVRENLAREAQLMTDESRVYVVVGRDPARDREPLRRRIREEGGSHRPYQHYRRLLLRVQARDAGRLPALRAPSSS